MKRLALAAAAALLFAAALMAQAAAEVTVGQSGWNWGSPQPQGHTLNAIEFAGTRGYAVGQFGTLLRTDDGGASWRGIATGTTFDLARVRAVDSNSVVIGAGCLLRRSDDGGTTFRRLLFTSSESSCSAGIASFHFPTSQTGYLLLSDGTVLQTADGGASFSGRQAVPGTQATRPSGTAATPTDIFFTDANTGFATTRGPDGGIVYRTSDGGNTWFKQHTAARPLNSVFFADATTGYAVGTDNTVLKTIDSGDTWEPQTVAEDVPADELTSIRCATAMECLIATRSGDRVLRTTDGGATITAFNPSTRKIFAVAFSSVTDATGVGERGATVHSSNADAVTPSFTPVGDGPLDGTFGRMRASSDALVQSSGDAGKLALSTNGGRHWSIAHVPTTATLSDSWFVDANHGFVLDLGGNVFRTDNGGGSWALLDTGTSERPNAIYAPDMSTVLLFGPVGVRRSQDGGTSFDPVEGKAVAGASLVDYDRTSGGVLFAYGPRSLLVSSSVGAKWKAVKGPVKRPHYQRVDFVSETTGFALTTDGRVWKTANGGQKWSQVYSIGTWVGYDLAFSDASNGYLSIRQWGQGGQDRGWVLHTSDGGVTWRPQLIGDAPIGDRGLAAPVAGTAFARAGAADLFFTNTGGDKGGDTALTISATPPSVGRKARTVKLSGKLTPAVSGANVVLSARRQGNDRWNVIGVAKVSSSGTFTSSVRVRITTQVVAQWSGDAAHDGAGSRALTIARKLPKRRK